MESTTSASSSFQSQRFCAVDVQTNGLSTLVRAEYHRLSVSGEDRVLTVIHSATERKLSLYQSRDVLENSLTLEHSEEIRAIAQKMTEVVSSSRTPQMQP